MAEFEPQDFTNISPGGLDIEYTIPSLSSNDMVDLRTNVAIYNGETESEPIELIDADSIVRIENRAGDCWVVFERSPSNIVVEERMIPDIDFTKDLNIRVNYHENHISVYLNKSWAHTHSGMEFVYQDELEIYMACSENVTIEDITIAELHDWRHGIFTETEADGASIISTIIQERPVEVYIKSNGTIAFFYNVDPTPREITAPIRQFDEMHSFNDQAASDFILYYKDVDVIVDEDYLQASGFITKVLRLSGLDNGAAFAGRIIARRMREKEHSYRLVTRPDFAIEPGDVISIDVIESGTETNIVVDIFVETTQIIMEDGKATMQLTGRRHEPPE